MVDIRELDLSNTELILVESTIFGLLMTTDSGATVIQELIAAAASLSFIKITLLGDSAPTPNFLLSAPTSTFLVTTGILMTDELRMIASTSGFLVNTGLQMTDDSAIIVRTSAFLVITSLLLTDEFGMIVATL